MASTRIFWTTVAILAMFNIARSLQLFGAGSDLVIAAIAVLATLLSVRAGLTTSDLGLARRDVRSGLRWGAGAFAAVTVVVLLGAAIPATAGFLDDSRAQVSWPHLLSSIFIGTLLGTVIPEELLFRGVVLGSAVRTWGARRGLLVGSIVFGFWHILPTLANASDNAATAAADESIAGKIGLVVGAVMATTIAGAVFGWLRLRSRSLVAPVLAHLATNSVALVVAWALTR